MSANRFISAMEYIGDDLIERAAAEPDASAVRGTAIWTKGIAAAACLSLIVSGAYYVGMWYNRNNQGLVSEPGGDDPVITTKGKPVITTESKPQITTGSKPVITSESKPAVVTESEPVITSESKPVVTEESKPPVTTENKPGDNIFTAPSNKPMDVRQGAWRSESSKFKLDEVAITFYYGQFFYENLEWEYYFGEIFKMRMYMKNDEGTEYHIRSFEDQYVSEEYRVRSIEHEMYDEVSGETYYRYERVFNHWEKVEIPKEMFSKSSGWIELFVVRENGSHEFSDDDELLATTYFYYSVEDGYVTISSRKIESKSFDL